MPDRRRSSLPRRAQHSLGIAIDVAKRRSRRIGRKQRRRFVPLPLELDAVPAARLVAAGDENHPFLRAVRGGVVGGQEGFVVGHGEGGDVFGGEFGGAGADGVFDGAGDGALGEVGFCFFVPGAGLVAEGSLSLGCCEGWEGEREGGGEMHDGGLIVRWWGG